MMNIRTIAESLTPSFLKTGGSVRPTGIGVRSAAVAKNGSSSSEARAARNIFGNLAVLSKTPSSSLLASIRSAHPDKDLIIVGVDGPTGAGRAGLCEEMQKRSDGVVVISAADFRRPLQRSPLSALSSRQFFEDCFDWQRLRREVLEPLSKGLPAQYRRASEGGQPGEWVRVEPRGIVLFEGVYTLRPELYPFYDYTVFVKPMEGTPAADPQALEAEGWYLDAYHPAAMADTLLEGDWF